MTAGHYEYLMLINDINFQYSGDSFFSDVMLYEDGLSSLQEAEDDHAHVVETSYDAVGRPVQITNADGTHTSTIYDAAGRVRYTIDELGRKTENIYDKYGRLERTVAADPDGPHRPAESPYTRYEYDAAGNVVKKWEFFGTVGTAAIEHANQFLYDARNRLVTTVRKDGTRVESVLSPTGQVVASVDALGNSTYSVYDDRGRVIEQRLADPDGSDSQVAPVTTHEYDAVGNVTATTGPLQNTTNFKYDSLNRLREESHDETLIVDGSTVADDPEFTIDLGLVDTHGDPAAYGGVWTAVVGSNLQATWKFNNLEADTYKVSVSDVVLASHAGTVIEIWVAGSIVSSAPLKPYGSKPDFYTVHGDREIGWNTAANEINVASGQNLQVVLKLNGGVIAADAVRLDRTVSTTSEYDGNGNLVKNIDTRGNDTRYFYDELNRLQQTQTADPDSSGSLTRLVTDRIYDGYGNLVTERHGYLNAPPAQTYTTFRTDLFEYDQRNRLTKQTLDSGTGHENVVTNYEYDDAGNQTRVIDPLGFKTHYRYNALNRVVDEYQDFGNGLGSAPS